MTNNDFLEQIEKAFKAYLKTGARSNQKLKVLHGAIASDLANTLGKSFSVHSLGYNDGKETEIAGRYLSKRVDIVVSSQTQTVGGIAVKFVMSNYKQNSNNYFENMLGETANIRTTNKGYFQVLILPRLLPYFRKDGSISKIEEINQHNMQKYIKMSNDNTEKFLHTPNKTLIYIVDFLNFDLTKINDKNAYVGHFAGIKKINISAASVPYKFGDAIIVNDYELFLKKTAAFLNYL